LEQGVLPEVESEIRLQENTSGIEGLTHGMKGVMTTKASQRQKQGTADRRPVADSAQLSSSNLQRNKIDIQPLPKSQLHETRKMASKRHFVHR
jgi:hypothetical protein